MDTGMNDHLTISDQIPRTRQAKNTRMPWTIVVIRLEKTRKPKGKKKAKNRFRTLS